MWPWASCLTSLKLTFSRRGRRWGRKQEGWSVTSLPASSSLTALRQSCFPARGVRNTVSEPEWSAWLLPFYRWRNWRSETERLSQDHIVNDRVGMRKKQILWKASQSTTFKILNAQFIQKYVVRGSPGSPVAETLCSQYRGSGFSSGQGTRSHLPQLRSKIPSAATKAQCSQINT